MQIHGHWEIFLQVSAEVQFDKTIQVEWVCLIHHFEDKISWNKDSNNLLSEWILGFSHNQKQWHFASPCPGFSMTPNTLHSTKACEQVSWTKTMSLQHHLNCFNLIIFTATSNFKLTWLVLYIQDIFIDGATNKTICFWYLANIPPQETLTEKCTTQSAETLALLFQDLPCLFLVPESADNLLWSRDNVSCLSAEWFWLFSSGGKASYALASMYSKWTMMYNAASWCGKAETLSARSASTKYQMKLLIAENITQVAIVAVAGDKLDGGGWWSSWCSCQYHGQHL